eukprot:2663825-Pleurochrysis_carterae.AAC.2
MGLVQPSDKFCCEQAALLHWRGEQLLPRQRRARRAWPRSAAAGAGRGGTARHGTAPHMHPSWQYHVLYVPGRCSIQAA